MLKIVKQEPIEEDLTFPLLAKGCRTEVVVLFNTPTTGMVLNAGSGSYEVGAYPEWTSVFDKKAWTILPKDYKLVLSNG